MTLPEIKVAVGGGLELDRAGLAALIASLPGLHVVPLGGNPPPQVLVWRQCKVLGEIPAVGDKTAILLLTEDVVVESLPQSVIGLFSRDESPAALGLAIRQVARGEQYLSPSLAAAILQIHQADPTSAEDSKFTNESLTERERQILDLLGQGLSNKMIAAQLYLSVRTVEGHLANIYARLDVHSRTEAILIANKIPKALGPSSDPSQGQV